MLENYIRVYKIMKVKMKIAYDCLFQNKSFAELILQAISTTLQDHVRDEDERELERIEEYKEMDVDESLDNPSSSASSQSSHAIPGPKPQLMVYQSVGKFFSAYATHKPGMKKEKESFNSHMNAHLN